MESIQWAGFDCVTLANNHFRDQGEQGVRDTLSACDKYGIDHVGGGLNLQDARQILYKEIIGEKLAVVNFCENEWSIASDKYGGSAPLNPVQNYYQIQEAKQNADCVLVIVHGGIEMYQYPTPRMQETYRFFIDAGADAVVNHHQHCYSGYEVYQGKPIFYGLGNFCLDMNKKDGDIWGQGYLSLLQFGDTENEFTIVPCYQCGEKVGVSVYRKDLREEFNIKLSEINQIIKEQDSLQARFHSRVNSIYEYRMLALEPFYNKYIRTLQQKKLLPRLIREDAKKSMLMRVRCESNRETLLAVLKKYFNL